MTDQGIVAGGSGGHGRDQGFVPPGTSIATELDAAGVPHDAMQRLAELEPGKPGSIFTSDLSVNEFLLVREVGFRPLGLVLGSSIYHVGLQVGRWGSNQELDVLSQAMYHARELAMSRMEAEADALRAGGGGVSNWRNNKNQPFTSDLSGQDFWTLIRAEVNGWFLLLRQLETPPP